jgi:hypothetical protein
MCGFLFIANSLVRFALYRLPFISPWFFRTRKAADFSSKAIIDL